MPAAVFAQLQSRKTHDLLGFAQKNLTLMFCPKALLTLSTNPITCVFRFFVGGGDFERTMFANIVMLEMKRLTVGRCIVSQCFRCLYEGGSLAFGRGCICAQARALLEHVACEASQKEAYERLCAALTKLCL